MRRVCEKLHSRRGASLLYALALMLVAATVSSVILTSAVTANRRVHDDLADEQEYLSITSAAKLIARELDVAGCLVTKTKVETFDYTGTSTGTTISLTYAPVGASVFNSVLTSAVEKLDPDENNINKTGASEEALTVVLSSGSPDGPLADMTTGVETHLKISQSTESGNYYIPVQGSVKLGDSVLYLSAWIPSLPDPERSADETIVEKSIYTEKDEDGNTYKYEYMSKRTSIWKTTLDWNVKLSANKAEGTT